MLLGDLVQPLQRGNAQVRCSLAKVSRRSLFWEGPLKIELIPAENGYRTPVARVKVSSVGSRYGLKWGAICLTHGPHELQGFEWTT